MKNRIILFVFVLAFTMQSCCIFKKGTGDPLPCCKSKKSKINGVFNEEGKEHNTKNIGKNDLRISNEIEEKITSAILAIPEVQKEAKYIENTSNGERHLIIWIYQTPKKLNEKYYWVKAGEDNGDAFSTHFNFFIYPENLEVKFLNTLNDSVVSLDEWRKELSSQKKIVLLNSKCYLT
jgi:hypothetical protein